jgi:hypothetical protein
MRFRLGCQDAQLSTALAHARAELRTVRPRVYEWNSVIIALVRSVAAICRLHGVRRPAKPSVTEAARWPLEVEHPTLPVNILMRGESSARRAGCGLMRTLAAEHVGCPMESVN